MFYKCQKGVAMLVSVIILSTIMLGFAVLASALFIKENQIQTILKNKKIAAYAASGCMEIAFDRLGRNALYGGNETVFFDESSCTIRPILGSSPWVIETESTVGRERARYRANLSSKNPIVITSWEEVVSF